MIDVALNQPADCPMRLVRSKCPLPGWVAVELFNASFIPRVLFAFPLIGRLKLEI